MMKILLVSAGIFHPPLLGRTSLHRALQQIDGLAFVRTPSLENLPGALDGFSALVLHFHHRRISPPAFHRLEAFVQNGGGILAIHAATASFKETQPYFDILGGRFIEHGPVTTFEAGRVKGGPSGLNAGLDLFTGIESFTVRDELYIHELQPGNQIHFIARHEGQDIPVVWTRRFGQGRVCYACPGHRSATMNNPAYQEVLRKGLQWVARCPAPAVQRLDE